MNQHELSRNEIAKLWNVHPSSVPKIMGNWGFSGRKNGAGRGCRRTYLEADVNRVNQLRTAAAARNGAGK